MSKRVFAALLVFICTATVYYLYLAEKDELVVQDHWSRVEPKECRCRGELNCYRNPGDASKCGRCLACTEPVQHATGRTSDDPFIFAVSAHPKRRTQLFVLLASIQKHFKEAKTVIFEEEAMEIQEWQALAMIRNVEIKRNTEHYENFTVHNRTAMYLEELLTQHRSVLWMRDEVIIDGPSIVDTLRQSKSLITVIGPTALEPAEHIGFTPFFPGQSTGKNYSALFVRRGAKRLLSWMTRCVSTPECSECIVGGRPSDCFPFLLSRLWTDFPVSSLSLSSCSLRRQSGPPQCDFRCFLKFSAGMLGLVSMVIFAIWTGSALFIQKKKK